MNIMFSMSSMMPVHLATMWAVYSATSSTVTMSSCRANPVYRWNPSHPSFASKAWVTSWTKAMGTRTDGREMAWILGLYFPYVPIGMAAFASTVTLSVWQALNMAVITSPPLTG